MVEIDILDIIGGAKVICYAVVNAQSSQLQPVANGLAICQYSLGEGFYLFRCDSKWLEYADTWHETLEDAKDQAEHEYKGISAFGICK